MRRHAENAADGDDAGAADTGDDDVVGLVDGRKFRLRQLRQVMIGGDALALFQLGAVHRDERRAEAFDAGKVLVAARLVDGALAAPFGLERLHRDAVRLDAAIAAAFADQFVDDHALVGIGKRMALAAAALLGGAGLVIDQDGDARHFGKRLLHRDQIVAVMNGDALRPDRVACIFVRLVGDDDDALGALRRHLPRDLRHGQPAVIGLAAGHGDRVIEQDLVGDVGVGRDRGADRHIARVIISAVAEILKDVIAVGERRLADPIGALAAHMRVAERRAVHPLRHVMAADAGIGAHAFRHHGRGIVRAAGAEIRNALGDVLGVPRRSAALPSAARRGR